MEASIIPLINELLDSEINIEQKIKMFKSVIEKEFPGKYKHISNNIDKYNESLHPGEGIMINHLKSFLKYL